ncbi:MAG: peptidylprolyl isomerase [Cyanobacteria bacterium P01_F01_bin.150]
MAMLFACVPLVNGAMAALLPDHIDMEAGADSTLNADVEHSALGHRLAKLNNAGLISYLPPGNAITDGKALLRYSLPIDNLPIRKIQGKIEEISNLLRIQGKRPLSSVKRNLSFANKILSKPEKILEAVPDASKPAATALLGQVEEGVGALLSYVEEGDRNAIYPKRLEVLEAIGRIEELMVTEFPFEIPEEYDALPRLLGRATVEMETDYGKTTIVLDGYSAPLTAGNFVDLVQRGFYDGTSVNRVEDFYVVQAGDPDGPEDGFIDPETGEERTVPLEVLVQGDKDPLYGFTMEQMGITLDDPVLPFSAFGTLAMARPDSNVNGGSSQFFFLKFQTEMTPAGINMLDGEYAVFGYAVENKEIIDKFAVGDRIKSIRVIDGAENLKPHA